MARDIGPDMLANIDRQLAEGAIDQPTYDARRTETLELIRRGKAIQHTKAEMVIGYGWAIFATLLAACLLVGALLNASLLSGALSIGLTILAVLAWRNLR